MYMNIYTGKGILYLGSKGDVLLTNSHSGERLVVVETVCQERRTRSTRWPAARGREGRRGEWPRLEVPAWPCSRTLCSSLSSCAPLLPLRSATTVYIKPQRLLIKQSKATQLNSPRAAPFQRKIRCHNIIYVHYIQ